MHYKNGREAKNGDKVVMVQKYQGPSGETLGSTAVGILYDAQAGNDYCNGKLALISTTDPMPNLKECLHLDDVLAAIEKAPELQEPGSMAKAHAEFTTPDAKPTV